MRRLLWLLLAAAVGVLVASQVAGRPGYLLLAWGDWRVEIRSLLVALLLGAGVFCALHWLLGSATRARQALWRRALLRRLRRREQAERDLAAGVLAVLEGHYAQAEKLLQRSRRATAAPVLQALMLAHVARQRGDTARREREFAAARAAAPQAQLAIAYLQARTQLDAGDTAAAAQTLKTVADHASPRLLEIEAQLARARADWQAVQDLLPRLRRAGLLDSAQAAAEEAAIACARLADSEVPDLLWQQLSRRLRRESAVRLAYALALRRVGRDDAAQAQLAELLRDGWDGAVIDAFGRHTGSDVERQLTLAEGWLKAHPNDADLLLALGRLAGRARFWAKARTYFESSLRLAPTAVGHLELAQLLDEIGDTGAAAEHYRAGLQLALAPAGGAAGAPSLALTGSAPAADDRQHLLPYEA
jgi:HemY protein